MKVSLPVLFAIGTALCWGLYGPVIANARSSTGLWSPFKPYVGIGLAYIVCAVFGGLAAMAWKGDNYSFFDEEQWPALKYGFLAGILGALGALSLTSAMLSFNGPPKPQLVMPIVFGGAVSITAIVSVIQHRSAAGTSPWLWVGMAGVVISIVLVAYHTPHGGPHQPKASEPPAVVTERTET